jgi:HEAT repeat protein
MKGRKVMGLFGSPNVRKMEAKRNVEGLIKVLRSRGDIGVRKEVAGALGRIGDARAVEPLIKALQHFAYDVRKAAASALGQIGDTRAVEPLIAALNVEDRDVRSPAARALGQIGDTRAVEPLIAALNDDKSGWSVRTAAIDALERFGEARAVEALIATLKNSNTLVRKAAATSLVKLYQSRSLSETQKQLILDQRGCMSEAHTDVTSEPCGRAGIHTDNGIGVAFPI